MSVAYKGYNIPELTNTGEKLFDIDDIEVMGPPAIFDTLLVIKNANNGNRIITSIDINELEKLKSLLISDSKIKELNRTIVDSCKVLIDKRENE